MKQTCVHVCACMCKAGNTAPVRKGDPDTKEEAEQKPVQQLLFIHRYRRGGGKQPQTWHLSQPGNPKPLSVSGSQGGGWPPFSGLLRLHQC